MSDLLSRLGQRALGLQPSVQPLVRPGKEATPREAESGLGAEEFAEAVPLPLARRQVRESRQVYGSASQGVFKEQRRAPHETPQRKQDAPPRKIAHSLNEVIRQIYTRSEPLAQEDDSAPVQSAPQEHRIEGFQTQREDKPVQDAMIGHGEQERAPVVKERPSRRKEDSLQPMRLQQEGQSVSPSSTAERTRNEVQVSIGRIELHVATPPVSQAVGKTPKSTSLSLESYLLQRRGERR